MQISAFHAIYKRFRHAEKPRTVEEDFVEAIVLTSDDAMKNTDPLLIEQWQFFYDQKTHPKSRNSENIVLDG